MIQRIRVAALSLSLLVPVWAGPAGASDRVALQYDLSAGGLGVAVGQVSLDLGGDAYVLQSTMETIGLAAMLTGFSVEARSAGALGAALQPRKHHHASVWSGENRRVDLRYAGAGLPPQAEVVPEPDADDRVPVAVERTEGTLDPLSAIFALMRGLEGQGRASVTVFDGRRLYTLSAGDLVPRTVEAPGYTGTGWRASLRYERLGGQSKRSFFKESDEPAVADLDLAPGAAFGLPDDLMVPVRVVAPLAGAGGLVVLLREAVPVDTPGEDERGGNGGQAAAIPEGAR